MLSVVCFFSRRHLKARYLYLLIFRNTNHFIRKLNECIYTTTSCQQLQYIHLNQLSVATGIYTSTSCQQLQVYTLEQVYTLQLGVSSYRYIHFNQLSVANRIYTSTSCQQFQYIHYNQLPEATGIYIRTSCYQLQTHYQYT